MPTQATNIKVKKEDFSIEDILPATKTAVKPSIVPGGDTVVDDLNTLLANEFAVFTKTLNYHWNVEGPRFKSIHEFLETQYRQLLDVVDDLAERIRKLDANAIGTMKEFERKSTVVESPGLYPKTETMLSDLKRDHEAIQYQITRILDKKRRGNIDPGTEDFLVGLLRKHEDMTWRLKSHFQ